MSSKNKQAMILAIIAGILLLFSGINGFATWDTIKDFVTENIVENNVINIVFAVLIFIASLGGISVIIGGLLIGKENIRIGKFLILLGAGLGLIGLLVSIVIAVYQGSSVMSIFSSVGSIGIVLSIVARKIAS